MAIEESKIYEESCTAFRHYSTAVMNIRMLVFAQGLAILTAAGYFISSNKYIEASLTCVFGLGFTVILAMIQSSYYNHANNILEFLLPFEIKITSYNQGNYGPWNAYAQKRNELHQSLFGKMLIVQGPYVLFLMAFGIVLIWAFVKALS